jgi:hypothetical protein
LISVEGAKLKAKPIPKKQLLLIWKTLTRKPYPRVKAFKLGAQDFDRALQLKKCKEDQLRELKEWDTILSIEGTDACIFNTDETAGLDFMILIRENHYHKLEKILKHELSHIVRGDLAKLMKE